MNRMSEHSRHAVLAASCLRGRVSLKAARCDWSRGSCRSRICRFALLAYL